jgi:2-amino-4-hydroxy-6-hydroxymethyldihydropteridine diphosphokinase
MRGVFIGVGSNIDPAANIRRAVELLGRRVRVVRVSTFYLTAPVGRTGQPPFYNGVLEIETDLGPRELKRDHLSKIESELGRVRTADSHAPRTIDLDLIVYNDLVIAEEGLNLPDPEIPERPFLAVPLWELAPKMALPGSGLSLAKLAAAFKDHGMKPLESFTGALRRKSGLA